MQGSIYIVWLWRTKNTRTNLGSIAKPMHIQRVSWMDKSNDHKRWMLRDLHANRRNNIWDSQRKPSDCLPVIYSSPILCYCTDLWRTGTGHLCKLPECEVDQDWQQLL